MTANPEWPEILAKIPKGDKAYDHPTIVARVFYLKVKQLLFQLIDMKRLGTVIAYVYTIEFQKRGLPHLHLMVTLEPKDCPNTPEKIDTLVTAEIPNPDTLPRLHALIKHFMLHEPCQGRNCWNGNSCKYGYPRPFTDQTVVIDGAYPVYLRWNDGQTIEKHKSKFSNQHVVPYNKFLTLMFEAHINVEIPVNSTAIKYLYKYITKGHDQSHLLVKNPDETETYLNARYVGPPEAAWRLFKFPMSDRFPAVTRLNLHEEGEQVVYFPNSASALGQINSGKAERITLTGYFQLNIDNELGANNRKAQTLYYEELPTYFTWQKSEKTWKRRLNKGETVGRIFSILYLAGETFFLEACNALGLLVDNTLYDLMLQEASLVRGGYHLTQLFAMMCMHTPPSLPSDLIDKHFESFTNNTTRKDMSNQNSWQLNLYERQVLELYRLGLILKEMGESLSFCNIQVTLDELNIIESLADLPRPLELLRVIRGQLARNIQKFNGGQASFYNAIKRCLKGKKLKAAFYLDGPGGTGKTYTLNTIIDLTDSLEMGRIVVASTGVAALLLTHGQTAHSAFKIPLDVEKDVDCAIDPETDLGKRLIEAKLVIWDEVVTVHKNAIEAVDRTLFRLKKVDSVFGGKVVIFSGDFRQILPVVKFNAYPQSLNATIKSSTLWGKVKTFALWRT
ncbi:hypothetical protein PCASD_06867 [Puccinia coronata f. sp. avenae]|uniref:ATP-dependent DNA helicase n=1 Tax=Puccinia coronata f. sp. avenae TaxID=200324 RepID=A0A2N5UYF2_9BASI|nr:hypothetical protein PCASD_06867 [Puccinia coronata f. sp. avenae]